MATSTNSVIAALKSRLEGSLPALVSAQSLAAIGEFLEYYPAVLQIGKGPQIWIDIETDSRSADDGRGATLHRYSQVKTVMIGITTPGTTAAETLTDLRAYVDLIRQCLEGDQTVGGTALWCLWRRTNYTPVFKQGMALYRAAILTFDVNRRCNALGTD